MRKVGKILITVGGLVTLVVLAATLAVPKGPRYNGRPLAEWLTIYYESDRPNRDRAQRPVAAAAIRTIGTNALPRLLEWLRYEAPPWHRDVARVLPRRIGNSRLARATAYRGYHRAEAAQAGLQLLGSNIVSVIPELTAMMQDTSHPQTAIRAMSVLNRLGSEVSSLPGTNPHNTNQPPDKQRSP